MRKGEVTAYLGKSGEKASSRASSEETINPKGGGLGIL